MNIRKLEERDMPVIRGWHEDAGFDYPLPNFTDPIFAEATVLVDADDKPVQAIAAKKTVELFLLMDGSWRNPRWRLEALMQMHEDMRQRLVQDGIEDVFAFLPPEVEKSFGKRLQRIFHWIPGRWKHYSRPTKGEL